MEVNIESQWLTWEGPKRTKPPKSGREGDQRRQMKCGTVPRFTETCCSQLQQQMEHQSWGDPDVCKGRFSVWWSRDHWGPERSRLERELWARALTTPLVQVDKMATVKKRRWREEQAGHSSPRVSRFCSEGSSTPVCTQPRLDWLVSVLPAPGCRGDPTDRPVHESPPLSLHQGHWEWPVQWIFLPCASYLENLPLVAFSMWTNIADILGLAWRGNISKFTPKFRICCPFLKSIVLSTFSLFTWNYIRGSLWPF